jgi:dienelactone hydrolase
VRRLLSARLALALGLACAAAGALWHLARPYLTSAALVVRAADLQDARLARLSAWGARRVVTEDVDIPTRSVRLRARVYRPQSAATERTIVLSSGINPRGLDEPRLARFARTIAERGMSVITPELPDLLDFRVTPRLADQIEDVGRWAAVQQSLAPDGRVGLVGISFSGGLSVVAAGRQALREQVAFVVSLGGHGDLPRTLRYLSTGRLPDGRVHPAHDYGVVVVLHNVVEALVPRDQVPGLRTGVRSFLLASTIYVTDPARGARMAEETRSMEATLPEPARTLLHYVNTRDSAALAPLLAPRLPDFTSDPALSPERSPPPRAPVFLLHGRDDNVIPASETRQLTEWLGARGVRARALVTPLISHAQVDAAPASRDVLALIRFWADVLRAG